MSMSIFSDGPRIETQAGKLVARSSWWAYLRCLGLFSLHVIVEPAHSQVRIIRQFLWFFQTKRLVPFREIGGIVYDYQGPSASVAVRWLIDDYAEFFSVGLKLHDGTVIPLFEFSGYARGPQEEESRDYAEQLSEMIGVPVGR
jgi:hypothetical protein